MFGSVGGTLYQNLCDLTREGFSSEVGHNSTWQTVGGLRWQYPRCGLALVEVRSHFCVHGHGSRSGAAITGDCVDP